MPNRRLSTSLTILFSITLLSACGGGGSDGGSTSPADTATISGTVPGTKIEAFGDNGSYYVAHSVDDGTVRHPFSIECPAGLGVHLVMTTNPDTDDEVVSPMGWRDGSTQIHTRIVLGAGDRVDLGHIALAMSCAEAAGDVDGDGDNDDVDNDCVLDSPFILDDAHSPLAQADADHDGLNDFDDPDHGNYSYSAMEMDPLDHDGDGVPNMFDPDYMPAPGFTDRDRDGLHDETDDANPGNIAGSNHRFIDDTNGDGYRDGDQNHDGFDDMDRDRNGFRDDNDMNHGMRGTT